ncbi:hypothetical protein ILUMI_02103 [Ignelater luminosus]|uniref:CCHC-type domain-containing protein n=1 Tax=Ignelater luminosus TaxID=2038154 RepID=A0A8K0DH51_IGNLU|nr:hypothetical protein ILUMI_02103 [Ignelater luminosus]
MERVERKTARTQITKLINNAKDKLANVNENPNEFIVIRNRIRSANENLEQANEKVKLLLKEDEFEKECQRMLEYRDQVTEILSRLQIQIDGQYTKQEDDVASISSNVTQVSYKGNTGGTNVKLPKLELRNFKGELADWTLFWEQFRTVVHENESLDAVAKFSYLEHALIGKAAATISGLTPSERSYNAAIELLKHEYGNQQRIIDSHVQKLLSLTPIKSRVDAAGLRNLYNTTSSITRNLTSLGVKAEEYGMMVKSVILNSMPYGLKIDYYKQYPSTENAVDIAEQINNLLNYLKLEVESIEIAQPPASASKSSSSTFNSNKDDKRNKNVNRNFIERKQYTAAGLLTMVNECLFCNSKDHTSEKCNEDDITLEQRKQILKKQNRCFRCTKRNHNSKACRNKVTCDRCKYRHVTSMCDPNYKMEETSNATTSLFTKGQNNNEQIYLQTAKAYVSPLSDTDRSAFVRLIIDGGSQLSHIKQDVSRQLGLKILGTRNLSVMPFGCKTRTQPKLYNKVELKLMSQYNDESFPITNEFIENNIIMKDGRFEVSLPWKSDGAVDNNYFSALSRMKNLTFKLLKNTRLIEYDKVIREFIAEEIPSDYSSKKTYYMPHHPVYREDKTTSKIRVVFDALAHAPGFASLNELLYCGENLVQDIMKILLNFRVGKIAITADIEKAFLQIRLSERDRDCHRFLWYKHPITDVNSLSPIQEYRMTRVTFGVTSSPFLLSAALKKLFTIASTDFPETTHRLATSFYVDDLVLTVNSIDDAIKLFDESKMILKGAGMNLRKWHTNDRELQFYIKENEINNSAQPCQKVLGLYWDTVYDNIFLDLSSVISFVNKIQICTKKNVMQAIGRIYDPLQISGPFTITAKILLQLIWKLKIDWDSELPSEYRSDWIKWCNDLKNLTSYGISRSVVSNVNGTFELHLFSDASNSTYGTVAYVREIFESSVRVSFLIAKARVAPLKGNDSGDLSLPRLELTAALCASRLKDYIIKNVNLKFESINLWTDSKITLHWITGDAARWKTYVYNRAVEIQKLTKDSTWRHCAGYLNPADLLTRGVSANKLFTTEYWLKGPEFLSRVDYEWSTGNDLSAQIDESVLCANIVSDSKTEILKPIFPLENYEHLEKCLRVTAYVKRAFRVKNFPLALTSDELSDAEMYWIKFTHQVAFSREIEDLKTNNIVSNTSSIWNLTPFLDEAGMIRIRSRLQESDLPLETANPIILPRKSYQWRFS